MSGNGAERSEDAYRVARFGRLPKRLTAEDRRCRRCGRTPAAGFASIGDDWFCHGDDDSEPTCYMLASRELAFRDSSITARPAVPGEPEGQRQ